MSLQQLAAEMRVWADEHRFRIWADKIAAYAALSDDGVGEGRGMTDVPTPADVCDAIRGAPSEQALAAAWIGSRARRLEMSLVQRVWAIEAWIDAQSKIGDDGK